jgi:hypothetical protein
LDQLSKGTTAWNPALTGVPDVYVISACKLYVLLGVIDDGKFITLTVPANPFGFELLWHPVQRLSPGAPVFPSGGFPEKLINKTAKSKVIKNVKILFVLFFIRIDFYQKELIFFILKFGLEGKVHNGFPHLFFLVK